MKKETLLKIVGSVIVIAVIVLLGSYSYQIGKSGEVNVKTEKTEYQTGEALRVKIENNLRNKICFSYCYPYYFERKDEEWLGYRYEDCPNGDLVETCVDSKQVKAYEIIIPTIEKGIHRLALSACVGCNFNELFKEDKKFYSNTFIIK